MVPCAFDRETASAWRTIVAALAGWFTTFRVLALCRGRGAVAEQAGGGFGRFAAAMLLPVTFSPRRVAGSAGMGKLVVMWVFKVALTAALVRWLTASPGPGPLARHVGYSFLMMSMLGVLMDGPGALAGRILGVQVAPHMREPYLSTSLGDFWSRRWNLTASRVLRDLVYLPIVGKGEHAQGGALRAAGVMASFLASGVMHELIIWHGGGGSSKEWLSFFVVCGAEVVAEDAIRRKLALTLPRPLAVCLTLAVLLATAEVFFWPPIERLGWDTRALAEFAELLPRNLRA
mmetsp:Transcript_45733/g.145719  ORF Transcript_45733/g.145719 Transcript_45733/m.145719 type:complete len:289 (+) Transcript_45733:1071-1937(+)